VRCGRALCDREMDRRCGALGLCVTERLRE